MDRSLFFDCLPGRAESRIDRAVLIVAFLAFIEKETASLKCIERCFAEAHLSSPNVTVLAGMLTRDDRVSVKKAAVRPLKAAQEFLIDKFPELSPTGEGASKALAEVKKNLGKTPFIDAAYISDLEKMLVLYSSLHVMENSLRRLIEHVFERRLGNDWWPIVSSSAQQRKHNDRLEKENKRQWLPARSNLGPLYSLDWSDLISIIRKFESEFLKYIGEIDFLHRYSDLGLLRHVVAHNGFIDDDAQFQRISLALHDWQRQVGPVITGEN